MVKDLQNTVATDFPRSLQVLPALESGGVEKATVDWLITLRQKFPTAPLFVTSAGGGLVPSLTNLNVTHFTLPLNTKNPLKIIINSYYLLKIIKQHKIELVHSRSRAPAWSALLATSLLAAAWRLNIPLITTYHGTYNCHNYFKWLYNSVMVRSNKTIAISKFIANLITREYPKIKPQVALIREGIDTNYFDPDNISQASIQELRQSWGVSQTEFLILLPGRLTGWKGQTVLAKAIKFLTDIPLCVVFLGSDQGRVNYKNQLKSLTENLNVRFIDSCSSMPTAYAAADLVISCSTEPEAFGRITAEALAMARPFIGTNLGATPELCLNNHFLVPPGDVQALVIKIRSVFESDIKQRQQIGLESRRHIVQNFCLSKMVKDLISLYQNVAK